MKLIDGTLAEQIRNHSRSGCIYILSSSGLRSLYDIGFFMRTSQVLPWSFRRVAISVESEALLAEEETIGMGLGELKPIIVPALKTVRILISASTREVTRLPPKSWSSAPPCFSRNSASRRERSIQLIISKKRMKLDLPEPLAPMKTAALGISFTSTFAKDLNPRICTDSIVVHAHRLQILPPIIKHPNDYTLPTPVVIRA